MCPARTQRDFQWPARGLRNTNGRVRYHAVAVTHLFDVAVLRDSPRIKPKLSVMNVFQHELVVFVNLGVGDREWLVLRRDRRDDESLSFKPRRSLPGDSPRYVHTFRDGQRQS